MAAGSDSPIQLGGTGIPVATLKAVHEATTVTESVSEQGEVGESKEGRDQKEFGPSELKQGVRSPVQKGVGEDILSFRTTGMNVTEGEEKNMRPGHRDAPSGSPSGQAPASPGSHPPLTNEKRPEEPTNGQHRITHGKKHH